MARMFRRMRTNPLLLIREYDWNIQVCTEENDTFIGQLVLY